MECTVQRYNTKIIPGSHSIIELEIMGDAVNLKIRLWLEFMIEVSTDKLFVSIFHILLFLSTYAHV